MTDSERRQIKGALEECAEQNKNKPTPTFNIVVSSVCMSAVERIEELEQENADLKEKLYLWFMQFKEQEKVLDKDFVAETENVFKNKENYND